MNKMNYKKRTIWLVAVWILLFLVVSFATMYYGYARSVAEGSINVMGRGSGYMEMQGMYVI